MGNLYRKNFFYSIWRIILALVILCGNLIFLPMGLEVLKQINPGKMYILAIVGPRSISEWILVSGMFLWYHILLMTLVTRDAIKFKHKGVQTSPLLWAVGMILPTTIIVFPIYMIRRKITWVNKLMTTEGLAQGVDNCN